MATDWYIGIGGKARRVVAAYVGVGGKARRITSGYFGVGGKARQFWSDGGVLSYDKTSNSVPSMNYAYNVSLNDHLIKWIPSQNRKITTQYDIAVAYDKNFIINQNITTIQTSANSNSIKNHCDIFTRTGNYAIGMPVLRNTSSYSTSYIEAFDDNLTLNSVLSVTRKDGSAASNSDCGYLAFGYRRYRGSSGDQRSDITPVSKDLVIGNMIDSGGPKRFESAGISTDKYAIFISGTYWATGQGYQGVDGAECVDVNGIVTRLTSSNGFPAMDNYTVDVATMDNRTVYFTQSFLDNTYSISENLVVTKLGGNFRMGSSKYAASKNHMVWYTTKNYSSAEHFYNYVVGLQGVDKNQVLTDEITFSGTQRGNDYGICYWNKRFMCLTSTNYQIDSNDDTYYGKAIVELVKG